MSEKNNNVEQRPGSNKPQAPRAKSVESVDDASAQKPCNPLPKWGPPCPCDGSTNGGTAN